MFKKIDVQLIISAAISIACAASIFSLQKAQYNNSIITQKTVDYHQQEKSLASKANLIKQMPAFGFGNLVADWTFLKYIQYFGDAEARDKVGYAVVEDYFEAIVDKDPKFIKANLALSAGNSIFAGKPEKTIALLEESSKSLTPKMRDYAFMIFAYKAVDEILFLGDLEAAQKSYLEAARWAESRNDDVGNKVSKLYRATVKFLGTNPDSSLTQISGWSMVLRRNNDPKIQKHAVDKIKELGGEVTISNDGKLIVTPPKKDA